MSGLGMERGPLPAAREFDESWFEEDKGSRRRGRVMAIAAFVLIAALTALGMWNWILRGDGEAAATEQIVDATIGTITESIETSGTVQSQSQTSLNFESSGKVETLSVALGQQVKKGDVLATLDAPALEDAVRRAEIGLLSAQLKLNELLKGTDAAELAQTDQGYQSAIASYESAQKELDELHAGPTSADLSAAQQQVYDAEAALARAEAARDTLDTAADDAVADAEATVTKAENALDQAEQQLDDADDALAVAEAQLKGAEAAYCPDADVSFCVSPSMPLSSSDQATLLDVAAGGDAERGALANSVLNANTTYRERLTALNAAEDALDDAESDLDHAEEALDDAEEGPSDADIREADASVGSAQLALTQAQAALTDLQDGADADETRAAELALAAAEAGLRSAEAQRDEAHDGTDADEVTEQRGQVDLEQLSLAEAKRDLEDAQLIAPFDGTVADVNIATGDTVGAGGGEDAAIVLNTPDALVIELAINEADLANVEVGQTGTMTFDQLDGVGFPIVIEGIGGNPTTTQGVTTYEAIASIDLSSPATGGLRPGGALPLGPGGVLPEGFTPPAGADTPDELPESPEQNQGQAPDDFQARTTESEDDQPRPLPGMTGSVEITVEEAKDVVTVPSAAVQQEGPQQYVEVVADNGERERVVVETGLSDGSRTAILAGLEAGEKVVVPTSSATSGDPSTGPGGPGGPGGGGPVGGGGGAPVGGPPQ